MEKLYHTKGSAHQLQSSLSQSRKERRNIPEHVEFPNLKMLDILQQMPRPILFIFESMESLFIIFVKQLVVHHLAILHVTTPSSPERTPNQ
jgi:hypothetical protein